jgi:hypothetical protein
VEDGPVVYDKIPRSEHNAREGKWTSYVLTAVDEYGERSRDQSFIPSLRNRRQKIYIFPELTDNPMCPCEEEEEKKEATTDHLIFRCKKLGNQRIEMIKQKTKKSGGNWPTTIETLVSKYLQIFVKFVKSINFKDLERRFNITDR